MFRFFRSVGTPTDRTKILHPLCVVVRRDSYNIGRTRIPVPGNHSKIPSFWVRHPVLTEITQQTTRNNDRNPMFCRRTVNFIRV